MSKLIKKDFFQSSLCLFVILFVWEVTTRLKLVEPYILPPLTNVLKTLFQEITVGKLGIQIFNSIYVILQGFVISAVIVTVISLLCTWLHPLEKLITILCAIFNPLPAVAVMPIIIMWFGISEGVMIAIIVHGTLWALMTYVLDGFRSVPIVYREWGKNIGLNPFYMFKDILIFAIMPNVVAGIRISWGRAWRALISAEMLFGMIGSLGGLGYYIYTNRAYANMSKVMAGVITICVIGIFIESVFFKQIEKRTIQKWGMSRE